MNLKLLKLPASSGALLFFASLLAILAANSSCCSDFYQQIFSLSKPLKLLINDVFMAIFFLLIGLELKKEIINGELSLRKYMILPIFAALGGVLLPAIIYFNINSGNEINLRGWAIPTATDIAFAIGIINLFGKKIPNSLRIFLLSLAIIDDLIAIIIIALFYSGKIAVIYLDLILLIMILLMIFNKIGINKLSARATHVIYILAGIILWILFFKSGIHPTLAGVVFAFLIPHQLANKIKLENRLYFPVNYLILPIFAFANSGIIFSALSENIFHHPVFLGIVLALFFGKQFGVAATVFLLVKLKVSPFFKDANWLQFYGVAIISGIGFTMSLFIGNLAFDESHNLSNEVIIGVMSGSILSAISGFLVIYFANNFFTKGK